MQRWSGRLTVLSFLLAILVSAGLLVFPLYDTTNAVSVTVTRADSERIAPSDPGVPRQTAMLRSSQATLLDINGPEVLGKLLLPVALAGLPLLVQRQRSMREISRIFAAVLLFGWVAAGSLSIGMFYLPSALAMFVAAWSRSPARA
jgi:hypothetical protein